MNKKLLELTIFGETHYIDFTKHVNQRSQQREVDDYMKRVVLLSLDRCKDIISENVGDEAFVITMPLLSFIAKRNSSSKLHSIEIITVVKGSNIKMGEGQKFFNITEDGVSYNTFHKKIQY